MEDVCYFFLVTVYSDCESSGKECYVAMDTEWMWESSSSRKELLHCHGNKNEYKRFDVGHLHT